MAMMKVINYLISCFFFIASYQMAFREYSYNTNCATPASSSYREAERDGAWAPSNSMRDEERWGNGRMNPSRIAAENEWFNSGFNHISQRLASDDGDDQQIDENPGENTAH